MALESALFISGLVSANPPGTDAISQAVKARYPK
jgi:hypothetical protein